MLSIRFVELLTATHGLRSVFNREAGKKLPNNFFVSGRAAINVNAMDVPESIWTKLTRVVLFLFVLAGLLVIVVWYLPLIKQNERMRKEIMRKDAQIQQEDEERKQLAGSIDALKHDPKTVERLARETLGYAKQGETVIRFEEPATNNSASR